MNEIDILSEVLALAAPDERRKFLDEASGDDRDLRNRAEALLRSSECLAGNSEPPPTEQGGSGLVRRRLQSEARRRLAASAEIRAPSPPLAAGTA